MSHPRDREAQLIRTLLDHVPGAAPPRGAGDDAAVLPPDGGCQRVITTDALIEGVHFLRRHPPAWLGRKALAVNLSDVAAMGAEPEAFLLAAAVPPEMPSRWWRSLAGGMGEYATETGVRLVGGDVVASPGPVVLTVTAWGRVAAGRAPLTRSGGEAGDTLLVRGSVGRAGLGLQRWLRTAGAGPTEWPDDREPAASDLCLRAHLRPEPPLDAGVKALAAGASAAMDLSDGLLVDGRRLAEASGVRVVVDLGLLPDDPAVAELSADQRVASGEDYGLLVLAPRAAMGRMRALGFHLIGRAEAAAQPGLVCERGGEPVKVAARPFEHFG